MRMPAPTPTDFGSSFEAPEHKDRLLQVLHPHPLDQRIVFYPGPHEYRVDGLKTTGSVTGLVHSFVEEFDGDGAIAKMAVSRNWPRPGYLRRPPPPEAVAALEELDPALGAALREPEMDEHLVSGLAQELKQRQRSALPLLAKLALSPDEIRQKWKANAEDASNRGTWMHLTFELWLNRDPVPMGGPEMALFQKFVRTLDGLTAYRTEWEIWGLEENLAGSIDFVAQAEDGRKRLDAMARTNSGFVLAEKDFEIRGPGELFGTRQSGLPPFQVADLSRDLELLEMARRDAAEWIDRSPRLNEPGEVTLRRRLMKRYGESLGIGDVG